MMDWLTNPEAWIALVTLTVLEIVLGIDNIIFISILVGTLPEHQRNKGRVLGLGFAMITRILLLLSITWVMRLTTPLFALRLVAQSLRQSGFAVRVHENLDRRAMVEALRDFSNRLGENTNAALYYAGHGLQLRDRNFLIPVDAEIRSEDEIPIAGVDIDFLLRRMGTARSRINIVILDACRNNPFAGKGGNTAQGLAQMDAPVGTLLAYATAPGKLAADGGGGANSLYATHLARALLAPGLPVEHVFKCSCAKRWCETRARCRFPGKARRCKASSPSCPASRWRRVAAAADAEAAGELAFLDDASSQRDVSGVGLDQHAIILTLSMMVGKRKMRIR